MIFAVEIGELLVMSFSGYIFVTPNDNDIRTNHYLEKGSVVIVISDKIRKKFINITSGESSGWIHMASVEAL